MCRPPLAELLQIEPEPATITILLLLETWLPTFPSWLNTVPPSAMVKRLPEWMYPTLRTLLVNSEPAPVTVTSDPSSTKPSNRANRFAPLVISKEELPMENASPADPLPSLKRDRTEF